MLDLIVVALLWLALSIVLVLIAGVWAALGAFRKELKARHRERVTDAQVAHLVAVTSEAFKALRTLDKAIIKPDLPQPVKDAAGKAKTDLYNAVEDALKEAGYEMPEGWA